MATLVPDFLSVIFGDIPAKKFLCVGPIQTFKRVRKLIVGFCRFYDHFVEWKIHSFCLSIKTKLIHDAFENILVISFCQLNDVSFGIRGRNFLQDGFPELKHTYHPDVALSHLIIPESSIFRRRDSKGINFILTKLQSCIS